MNFHDIFVLIIGTGLFILLGIAALKINDTGKKFAGKS